MTTKEYLLQLNHSRNDLQFSINSINEKRGMLTSISVNTENEHVQSSSDPDKVANMIATILERESELQLKVNRYIDLERTITDQIETIKNAIYRDVLYYRYVRGMTFDAIAVCIGKSKRHTTRIHGMALLEFEKIFGKNYLQCP